MYKNIGQKIKDTAKILFFLGCSIGVFIGFLSIATDCVTIGEMLGFAIFFLWIVIFAWILYCLMYGFGELIDKVTKIEEHLRNKK